MIKEIIGNFSSLSLCGNFDVICCYTDCMYHYSTESAKLLKNLFPDSYKADLKTNSNDVYKLGEVSTCYIKDRKLRIFNLYIKFTPIDEIEYTALALSFRNMINFLEQDKLFINSHGRIGLTMIENRNSVLIKQIINQELSEYNITVVK
jgi:hypothetical protein